MNSIRLQARFVVASPDRVLHPGQIVIAQGRIADVTSGAAETADLDLGDRVILPGLINAHTHLEFSDLRTPFAAGSSFPDWIRSVIRHRREQESQLSGAELMERRKRTVSAGLAEARATGTVYLADIVTEPWRRSFLSSGRKKDALPAALSEQPTMPLTLVLPEIIGLTAERFEATKNWATGLASATSEESDLLAGFGISPHAPYSLLWDELERLFQTFPEPSLTAIHVAESIDELKWLEEAGGAFLESFSSLGIPIPKHRPQIDDAIAFLLQRERALLVHGNYLTRRQIETLAGARQLSVVYCPRTHRHFGHPSYPLENLERASVRVVLGTDSRASNPDLNLWSEVVVARSEHPGWSPGQALAAVTLRSAEALGIDRAFGSISTGKWALLSVLDCQPHWTRENLVDEMTSAFAVPKPWQDFIAKHDASEGIEK
ncbi:MAG: amidohydrolase family protein [bacterium]|nr:amidohydrolase family protein [bacterium]